MKNWVAELVEAHTKISETSALVFPCFSNGKPKNTRTHLCICHSMLETKRMTTPRLF